MTIREAIDRVDNLLFNTYTDAEKVAWLSRLDERVALLVLGTGSAGGPWYSEGTNMDTELLIQEPFSEVYIHWLMAQINYANGEIDKYNNAIAVYNAEYTGYAEWYHRNNRSRSPGNWVM